MSEAPVRRSGTTIRLPKHGHTCRNEKWFRRGLVFKAQRWLYHSTLGSRVIEKKKKGTPASLKSHFNRIMSRKPGCQAYGIAYGRP